MYNTASQMIPITTSAATSGIFYIMPEVHGDSPEWVGAPKKVTLTITTGDGLPVPNAEIELYKINSYGIEQLIARFHDFFVIDFPGAFIVKKQQDLDFEYGCDADGYGQTSTVET
jgi:hypothetical protein